MRLTVTERTDEQLLSRVARGDEDAVEELLTRHWGSAYRIALRLSRDPGLAEDAAQEAFMELVASAKGFDPERRFRPWFFRIVRNVTHNSVRARGRREKHEQRTPTPLKPSELERLEQRDAVGRVLECLTATYRETISLHFLDGLTQREVAEVLECSEGTVASRVKRGLDQLRAQLSPAHALGAAPIGALLRELGESLTVAEQPSGAEVLEGASTTPGPDPTDVAKKAVLDAARQRRPVKLFAALALAAAVALFTWATLDDEREDPTLDAPVAAQTSLLSDTPYPSNAEGGGDAASSEATEAEPDPTAGDLEGLADSADAANATADEAASVATASDGAATFEVVVTNRGAPVPGAVVYLSKTRFKPKLVAPKTDPQGRTQLKVPFDTDHNLRVRVGEHLSVMFVAALRRGQDRFPTSLMSDGVFWSQNVIGEDGKMTTTDSGWRPKDTKGLPKGISLHKMDDYLPTNLRVSPGHDSAVLEIELHDLHVTGRVVAEGTGAPVAGTRVWLFNPYDAERLGEEVVTDDLGRFELYAVGLASDPELRTEGPAAFAPTEVDLFESFQTPKTTALRKENLTIRLSPALSMRGRLLDADGEPVVGQELTCWTYAPDSKASGRASITRRWATTNEEGRFTVPLTPGGGKHGPHSSDVCIEVRRKKSPHVRQHVVVTPTSGEVVVRLKAGHVLRGQVLDPHGEPVEKAYLVIPRPTERSWQGNVTPPLVRGGSSSVQPWFYYFIEGREKRIGLFSFFRGHLAETKQEGKFGLGYMPPGRYRLFVAAPGYARQELSVDLPREDPLAITLRPSQTIGGRVLSPDGKPVADVLVRAFPKGTLAGVSGWLSRGTAELNGIDAWSMRGAPSATNHQGQFELKELPAGEYDLLATPLEDVKVQATALGVATGTASVELRDAAQGLIDVEAAWHPSANRQGEAKRLTVKLWNAEGPIQERINGYPDDHSYQVPAGEVFLEVSGRGAPPVVRRVQVNPGERIALGEVALTLGGGTVELTLVYPPVPVEEVGYTITDPRSGQTLTRSLRSDSGARSRVVQLGSWPGEVRVQATWRLLGGETVNTSQPVTLEVKEGGTARATITLE